MFLNPAIPGVPVYITGGIILGNRFKMMCEPICEENGVVIDPCKPRPAELPGKDQCDELTSESGPFQAGSFLRQFL